MICIGCGTEYEGEYCPKCGQPANTRRITVKDAARSIFVSFLMGDSKFMYTCLHLITCPGVMVRDYLYGRRAKMMAPVPMLVRLVAVYLLVMFLTNSEVGTTTVVDESIKSNMHSESLVMFADFVSRIMSNSVLYSLFAAAFFVIPFYLLFKKRGIVRHDGKIVALNMAEHFCALVYVSCLNMLLSLIIMPIHNWTWVKEIADMLFLLFPIVMYRQLYGVNWWSSLWRCVLSWLMVVMGIIVMVLFVFGLFYGIDAVR